MTPNNLHANFSNRAKLWLFKTITAETIDADGLAALRGAYESLCKPAFKTEDGGDGEALAMIEQHLLKPQRGLRYIVSLGFENEGARQSVFKHSDDGKPGKPISFTLGKYFTPDDIGYLTFMVVAPEARRKGLGRESAKVMTDALLGEATKRKAPLRGIFLEIEKPGCVPEHLVTFDPKLRETIWHRMHAHEIPIHYVVPSFFAGEPNIEYLKLMALPHPLNGRYPNTDDISAYLMAFYERFGSLGDPNLPGMIRQLRSNYARLRPS